MAGGRKSKEKDLNVEPWDRQPNEGPEAFQAFAIYRDMKPKRSIREVARQLDKSATLISKWSSKHDWQTRVAAWDAELDREAQDARRNEVREMNKRHAQAALSLLELGEVELKKLLADAKRRKKAGDLSVFELIRLISEGARLERIARGEPETINRNEQTGRGGGPIETDDVSSDSAIERIAGRIAGIVARKGPAENPGGTDGSGSPSPGT